MITPMIHHSDPPQSYAPSNYDDDMCLKPPFLLWLAAFYLCRGIELPLIMGIGHYAGVNADAMRLMREFWTEFTLLPCLAALPVLFAMCRRSNAASNATRWIWKRGRFFLVTACLLDATAAFIPQWEHHAMNDEFLMSVITAAIDGYFLLYVGTARRVRDAFLDFPPRLPARI